MIQEEKEKRYQEIMTRISEKFNILEVIRSDMKQIKDQIFKNLKQWSRNKFKSERII
ncbi:BhlA holin family protein [Lutispora thermophila DSM 19022]|uniref:BhlA holin family protein n=2 Tax=Lutispora TaxID=667112 RepID=A0A1M6I813_9FIRM|nr:BhlA holin family protein [Lutispora thermophila DSM 19022]